MTKKIEQTRPPGKSSMGPDIRQILPSAINLVDPFIFLDHYGPFEKPSGWEGVLDHPHAGITTITYLLSGTNRHQDSLGNDIIEKVGELSQMRAGRGIVHAEGRFTQSKESEVSHGLQFWLSLPAKDKFIEPAYFHYTSQQLPEFDVSGAKIKVLFGQWEHHQSPASHESPVYLFDIDLAANSTIRIPALAGDSCGLYVIDGTVNCDGQTLPQLSITRFELEGDDILVKSELGSRIIVFGGTPLDEPVVSHGPFVLNNQEQLQEVIKHYQTGGMGTIKPTS